MQVPILLISKYCGISFTKLFSELSEIYDTNNFPVITRINNILKKHVEDITLGKPEFLLSKKWLNIYWPPGEFCILTLVENDIIDDYTQPLKFRTDYRRYDDDFIRKERNAKLQESDGRIADDMPADLKAEWEAYRQKLRDIPADWSAVPNHLIMFPQAPDGEYDDKYVKNEDPEHEVTLISARTAADNDAIGQLIPIAGIDEDESSLK